jgi:hypothetical protein
VAIKPSLRFATLLSFIHVLAGAVVCLTDISPPVGLALLLMISLSLLYHLARDVLLLLPNSWCEVMFSSGEQSVVTRDGSSFPFRIDNRTFVYPHFVVLRVNFEGSHLPTSRVIFPDALATGEFRALCVRLRSV